MTRTIAALATALAMVPGISVASTTLLMDDFLIELSGATGTVSILNFSSLNQWNITDGAVDLLSNGGFGLPCGSAGCLDLDGSAGNAARLESKNTFNFQNGLTYDLILDFSGKNGSNVETLTFGVLGGASQGVTSPLGTQAAFSATLNFVAGSSFAAGLFIDHDGGDNFGLVLDKVTLVESSTTAPVPLPATLPLMIAGLGGLAWLRRK